MVIVTTSYRKECLALYFLFRCVNRCEVGGEYVEPTGIMLSASLVPSRLEDFCRFRLLTVLWEGDFVELLALLEGRNALLGEGSDESCMYIWK